MVLAPAPKNKVASSKSNRVTRGGPGPDGDVSRQMHELLAEDESKLRVTHFFIETTGVVRHY